jgi:purine-nucleoside phosphorylase
VNTFKRYAFTVKDISDDRLKFTIPFKKSAAFIRRRLNRGQHDIAVVLGSGLGGFTELLSEKKVLKTNDVPGYPHSTVPGHAGEIISGTLGKKKILVFAGRVHYYESGSTIEAAATSIVAYHLGIKKILLTNAAGILNSNFNPGDLMLIEDQINLTFRNVLLDLKYPAVTLEGLKTEQINLQRGDYIYSQKLMRLATAAAQKLSIGLRSGVYVGLTGPSYETPAEVRFYRDIGGDAVGMSTVHEAIFACSVGMEILGVSCLTNYSSGITTMRLSHEEVIKIGSKANEKFSRLLVGIIESL